MRLIQMASNENQEIDFLNKKYTEPVEIFIGEEGDQNRAHLVWQPGKGPKSIFGVTQKDRAAAEQLEDFINELYILSPGNYIAGSPVGPFFAGTRDDLPTVIYAVNLFYTGIPIKVVGEAPTMADFMLDDSTAVDEDGNTIVR